MKQINLIAVLILGVMWGCVFLIHGIAGAAAWTLLKIGLPAVGLVWLIINLFIMIRSAVKRACKNTGARIIALILCVILMIPGAFFLDFISVAYPVDINKTKPAVTVRWPLKETTVIGWGGDSVKDNYHAVWSSERWAYDLLMEPFDVGSDRVVDYGIWDKEVIAPVSGIVVSAFDEEADIIPNTEEFLSAAGNHVYIRIEETGTYLLLCHLKKDSVTVKTGDNVTAGEVIGRVGNSGSTSEPHLHIHHQRHDPTKVPVLFAEGLPLYFENVGAETMPVRGSVISFD